MSVFADQHIYFCGSSSKPIIIVEKRLNFQYPMEKSCYPTISHLLTTIYHPLPLCNTFYPHVTTKQKSPKDTSCFVVTQINIYKQKDPHNGSLLLMYYLFYFLGFMRGKYCISLIGLFTIKANNLSPKPNPQAGGMPCSSASTNSRSDIIAS